MPKWGLGSRVGLALVLVSLTSAAIAAVVASTDPNTPYTFHYDNVLGTSLDLTVVAASEASAHRAETAVLDQIDRDAKILSSYDAQSEFSRWFQTSGRAVPVSAELLEVLGLFDRWRDRTAGALDPAAEGISRVWRSAAAAGRVPSDTEIARAVRGARRLHWQLDPVARTATHLSSAPLVLNSFTKSYIVDRAARAALASGRVRAAVVNIGGDLVARGDWTESVGIIDPLDRADNGRRVAQLVVRNRAVATSGGYRRGFDIGGRHYSHIVDPRTGQPTGHVLSATVISDDAVTAGALATAFCVLQPDEAAALAARSPGSQYLLMLADGRRIESTGWRPLVTPMADTIRVSTPIATVHAAGQTWNPAFELAFTIDLARPAGRAKRPYVAIWVEDANKVPVRTIALWFENPRWLPELRAWSRADRRRATAPGRPGPSSISSATRSPGQYTLKWDGKDQQGVPVKPGTYTVFIEAAREHGTYQLMQQTMDFADAPKRIDLTGNVEVAGVVLDYRKITDR
jgi:thiamine biosynthesis lipoprotein ApbE